jgi:hypothetical protein
MRIHTTLVVAVLAFTGCKGKDKPKEEPKGALDAAAAARVQDAAPAGDTAKPVEAGPKGRKAAGNDPKLVELAEGMMACTPDPAYPQNSCRDQIQPVLAAFDAENPAHVATAINFLEDEAAQVRLLGVAILADRMLMQTPAARASGARVAAAAAAETDATVAGLFGGVLLQGDFTDKAYADAIQALAASHPLPAMRASVISNLAIMDPARFTPFLEERYAAEQDHAVKLAILDAFYMAPADVCVWKLQTFIGESDVELAGKAGYDIVWVDGICQGAYDSFIAAYAEKVQTLTPDFNFVLNTDYMAQAKGATPEQVKAFCEAAKLVVANTAVSGMARAAALQTIAEHHPDGKAYAKGFVKDPDIDVAAAARKAVN